MTDIASRPPQSPRFRRECPSPERRPGAWQLDFNTSPPGFSIAGHLSGDEGLEQPGDVLDM
jgi:hypothetical protein